MSIRSYKDRIDKAVRNMDGSPLYNGSVEHASALAEAMFANADDHVWILSGSLNARVYGPDEVIEQAKLFLAKPSHTVRLLLEDDSETNREGHPFFEKFGRAKNMEIRDIPKKYQDSFDYHFMTADSKSYRFESDKTKCSAVAAFGDENGAKNLENVFSSLWNISKPLAS